MADLWDVIAELGLELHPDRIEAVARKIASLTSAGDFARVRPSFGPGADAATVNRLEKAWQQDKATDPAKLASALRGASKAGALAGLRGAMELVWTGPSTGLVPVRHTEEVLCEVIDCSRHRLFLVSFVAYDVERITKALNNAAARGVQIDVLLESSSAHGGKVSTDSVKAMRKAVPTANLYAWSGQSGKPSGASVHAKCAVADDTIAFITSANLTSAAMEKNMELGVLVRGGMLPDSLDRHLDALVTTGTVLAV